MITVEDREKAKASFTGSRRIEQVLKSIRGDFYNPDPLFSTDATYKIAYGIKSNGKTYAFLKRIIENYFNGKGQGVYVRRYDSQIQGTKGRLTFANLVNNGVVAKLSNGKYDGIDYYQRAWYFTKKNAKNENVKEKEPFCYARAINTMTEYNSTGTPNVGTVFLDEFIAKSDIGYIPDEFVSFQILLSDIVRNRPNVEILMAGNSINRFNPYFEEMGIFHAAQQEQGTIDIYRYPDERLSVAVEFVPEHNKAKENSYFFAFDNPKLEMITHGQWQFDIYPHNTKKFSEDDIEFIYFIEFNNELFQCEIVQLDDEVFTYIHKKTTPLKNPNEDLIFSFEYSTKPNWRRNILKPDDKLAAKIKWFFDNSRVLYQNNSVGDTIKNFIVQSSKL